MSEFNTSRNRKHYLGIEKKVHKEIALKVSKVLVCGGKDRNRKKQAEGVLSHDKPLDII